MSAPAKHFDLELLAPGVWVALHRPGGWAIGNAGLVDLGGVTLVFDTFLTPAAARDLHRAALELTGRAPQIVINSHHHNDHTRGNGVFGEGVLVSTAGCRERFVADAPEVLAYEREHAPGRLDRVLELLEADDEVERRDAGYFESYYRGMIDSHAEVVLRAPELTVTKPSGFHGGERRAELLPFGGGHSGDDAVLYLPDDGIVFCADLLFVGTHPYLPDGDPEAFRRAGNHLSALDADRYVPGHGPVASRAAFAEQEGYLDTLDALTAEGHERGLDADAIAGIPIPEAYRPWDLAFPFFAANLRFLHALTSGLASR